MGGGDLTFPDGFVVGTATSAHQIEGGNSASDWWHFELADGSPCAEPSGAACDSWNRWTDDVDLVADAGLTAYRFSVEWARLEPAEGQWDDDALARYRAMALALADSGVEPMVTLCHFTLPQWLAERGGWVGDEVVDLFPAYCARVVAALGDVVTTFFTINEPNVVSTLGWMEGRYPPGRPDDLSGCFQAHQTHRDAHVAARQAIKAVKPDARVGLTLSMDWWEADPDDPADLEQSQNMVTAIRMVMEDPYLELARDDDVVGVQCYNRARVGPAGPLDPRPGTPVTQMGPELSPEALEHCLRYAYEVTQGRCDLLVTENGLCTDHDEERWSYLSTALRGVHACLADGLPVKGYFAWSLLDNFEWDRGFAVTYGLAAVDRTTMARTPKPSLGRLGAFARTLVLEG